ncbi:ribbon-helix-helix domain-containing protein [Candidatus Neomicrothrix sp.]|uniref:CopG family transcriptional regulator n=1 Tax=Candidatus Neomicrothrix subdominans TaxID=2954438 RepID=A0A936N973_9ACTN|nr:ribbon-helix-helix domain-containing protein [Candidatus Microthrix sp.]MBK9295953.1 CopG family transcriptional regulator [Candidatus Microthrix subdominans]MBK6438757.1 CopG family transcriptional regulator [Candidatus Microthrix sp.]MBK6968882.1 CopG family transcriptional regulator [Candidatus Microthrix sp.]MBK7166316.1 CopG family transcriptional regulator [Candidatus Microthrix sp.]MBK9560762.1 CopG family transcriptional regulator [Candidatus Microthrix sp.]
MSRTQTMVQLNDDLVERLDVEAKRAGQSRSAFIRQVLSERLAELDTNAKIEQWVEGYRRIPPGTVDEWGDLEAEADDAGRRMARDLDEEERRAGFSW